MSFYLHFIDLFSRHTGTAVCIMPIYLAEIAPINLRGSIGVFSALMVTAGTVIAHVSLHIKKGIKISTNIPGIGSLISEIDVDISEMYKKTKPFLISKTNAGVYYKTTEFSFFQILYFAFCYTQTKWVIVAALTGAFSLFELAVLPFCPESPRWLLINRNNPIEAKKGDYI